MIDIQTRFLEHVNFNGPVFKNLGRCWPWKTYLTPKGYGTFRLGKSMRLASTCAYELFIGPRRKGKNVDHLCRNRACVNPKHLELVSCGENTRRGLTGQIAAMTQLSKTHCPQGHPYSGENLYVHNGHRQCKVCRRNAFKKWRQENG